MTEYYDDLLRRKKWQKLLSRDFLLSGTVARESHGRDLYVNNSFFKMVRSFELREMIVDGDSAFAVVDYDLVSPKGKKMSCDVAEFWKAKDGKLDSVAIYFDTAAFSKFMT